MSSLIQREIGISDERGSYIYFLTEETLCFGTLKRYFPSARGLTYCKNEQIYNIIPKNNYIQLDENINMYNVLYLTDQVNEGSVDEIIEKYFQASYTYIEICQMLLANHGIKMSIRKVKRILRRKGLKRKNIIETPLECIVAALIMEINSSGCKLGYRAHWLRLRKKYSFTVKQSTVLKVLRVIDPDGLEARSRRRLKRSQYLVPSPNHIWHVDGMDKLKQFGFAISGCVDGFSRKIIWLQVSTTNNKPEVIGYYYLQALLKHNCLPRMMRSDCGTENTLIEVFQKALRFSHRDEYAGAYSFIKGKSTVNERVEKYWRQLRNQLTEFYIRLFKTMVQRNLLDTSNPVHIECLRFCFGFLIQHELNCVAEEWNEHRIRKQNNIRAPCGIPNVMYLLECVDNK